MAVYEVSFFIDFTFSLSCNWILCSFSQPLFCFSLFRDGFCKIGCLLLLFSVRNQFILLAEGNESIVGYFGWIWFWVSVNCFVACCRNSNVMCWNIVKLWNIDEIWNIDEAVCLIFVQIFVVYDRNVLEWNIDEPCIYCLLKSLVLQLVSVERFKAIRVIFHKAADTPLCHHPSFIQVLHQYGYKLEHNWLPNLGMVCLLGCCKYVGCFQQLGSAYSIYIWIIGVSF